MARPELINVTIVPALPGYSIVHEDEFLVSVPDHGMKDDIVAWQTCTYKYDHPDGHTVLTTHIEPITLSGGSNAASYAILRPDGAVEEPYGTTYPSYRDYVVAMQQEHSGKTDGADA